ncbi:fluoride efflux transporter FluC [Rummeliibacillus pycnus]|uniref:fluoride efflux transporter FluC n=1 Tax=Rummeliibacillus pycnus TaxID=101070 RepID=UPI0037CC9837
MIWLVLAIGGGIGAAARYGIVLWMEHKEQPYYVSTFIVNSVGSLLMGLSLHISVDQQLSTAFFATGFLGAFTTFSTFAFDTVKLIQEKDGRGVFLYPVLTLFAGIILVTLGWQII